MIMALNYLILFFFVVVFYYSVEMTLEKMIGNGYDDIVAIAVPILFGFILLLLIIFGVHGNFKELLFLGLIVSIPTSAVRIYCYTNVLPQKKRGFIVLAFACIISYLINFIL